MRKIIILLRVFVLGFLIALLVGFQTAKAQYTPDGQGFPLVSSINIASPINSTYTTQLLTLNFTVKSFLNPSNPSTANITMVYNIDGKNNATIPIESTFVPIEAEITDADGKTTTGTSIFSYYLITGWAALPEIPEGAHNITVYAKYQLSGSYQNVGLDNSTVYFTVNDGTPPVISDLSLENKTYSQTDLPINFTTDQSTSWMGYSLDGKANITIVGNTTLTALTNGPHRFTVFANDTAGNMGASETINFNISPPPSPSPSASTSSSISPDQSSTASSSASEQPTSSPKPQSTAFPAELIYAVAGAVAIVVVATAAVVLGRRK